MQCAFRVDHKGSDMYTYLISTAVVSSLGQRRKSETITPFWFCLTLLLLGHLLLGFATLSPLSFVHLHSTLCYSAKGTLASKISLKWYLMAFRYQRRVKGANDVGSLQWICKQLKLGGYNISIKSWIESLKASPKGKRIGVGRIIFVMPSRYQNARTLRNFTGTSWMSSTLLYMLVVDKVNVSAGFQNRHCNNEDEFHSDFENACMVRCYVGSAILPRSSRSTQRFRVELQGSLLSYHGDGTYD